MTDDDKIQQLKLEYRRQTIAKGRARFIRREIMFSVVFFAILVILFHAFAVVPHGELIVYVPMLPISILGGYLHARWKWQDFMKEEASR